jgi:hypothetical protein
LFWHFTKIDDNFIPTALLNAIGICLGGQLGTSKNLAVLAVF